MFLRNINTEQNPHTLGYSPRESTFRDRNVTADSETGGGGRATLCAASSPSLTILWENAYQTGLTLSGMSNSETGGW